MSSVRSVDFNRPGRSVTVDIDGRFNCSYGRTRSITIVGSITLEENYGRYQWSFRLIVYKNQSISTIQVDSYKKKLVGSRYRPSKKIGRRSISTDKFAKKHKRTNDLWSQQWWIMTPDIHPPRSEWSHRWWELVQTHIQISTLIHRLIDRSVSHGRYRRSVRLHLLEKTVDINGQFDYTYGELRLIVDHR